MSEAQPQTDAARRAAARKAKILARGNTGLAKLAQTARGDEAQALYAENFKPSPSSTPRTETPPPVPSATASSIQQPTQPSWAPPPAAATPTSRSAPSSSSNPDPNPNANGNMSAEQQAMSAQLEAMMSMFGGAGAGAGGAGGLEGGEGGMPDFQRMMAQMMGDPSLSGAGGQNLLGDMDDPAGLGGGIPPNLFGGLGGLGSGGPGGAGDSPFPFPFPGLGGAGGVGGVRKSKSERYFPLVHFISIIALALFTVVWWEPALRSRGGFRTTVIDASSSMLGRWAGQLGVGGRVNDQRFRLSSVETVPVFWAFTTVELILQTSRFMIFKSPPPPHSLIQTFLPLLPPKISRPLITGSRYLTLLLQTYKDGALFVFALVLWSIVAHWLNGR